MNASWQSAGINADAATVALYAAAALIILLGVIAAFVLLRRRGGRRQSARRDNHRISVRDVIRVDERRRLVLIRRDDIEHLLLTGGDSDLVVESFSENGEAGIAAAPLFAPRGDRRQQKAAPALPRPREREMGDGRERENAYTAKPQRLPGQNGAEAAEPPAEAAESAQRRQSAPSHAPESRKTAPRPASASKGQSGRERENEAARPESGPAAAQRRAQTAAAAPREEPGAEAERPAAAANPALSAAPQNGNGRPEWAEAANAGSAERDMRPAAGGQAARPAPRQGPAPENYPRNVYALPERDMTPPPRPQQARPAGNNAGFGFKQGAPAENASKGRPGQPERAPQPPRPAPAGAYAPYLGYMPKVAPQPAAMPARPPRGNGAAAPQNASRGDIWPMAENRGRPVSAPAEREASGPYGYGRGGEADHAAARLPEREFGSPAPQGQQEAARGGPQQPQGQNWPAERRAAAAPNIYGRDESGQRPQGSSAPLYAPRPNNGGPREAASPLYPAFAGGAEQNNKNDNGAAFNGNSQSGRNGFSPILPADDDDFDKILQDELLRAPNTIRFPAAPKK